MRLPLHYVGILNLQIRLSYCLISGLQFEAFVIIYKKSDSVVGMLIKK